MSADGREAHKARADRPAPPGWLRKRLAASGRAFATTLRNPGLLRAQLAFGGAWTAEPALTVALAVLVFRDGGAAAAGRAAFVLTPSASLLPPVGPAFAGRFLRPLSLL